MTRLVPIPFHASCFRRDARAARRRPARLVAAALGLTLAAAPPAVSEPSPAPLWRALEQLEAEFDWTQGGLQGASRDPLALPLGFLLRAHRRVGDPKALRMVERTLDAARRSAMHDAVGGGFHRGTRERDGTVPRYGLRLDRNARLAIAYLEAFQVTGNDAFAHTLRGVLAFLARDLVAPDGGFRAGIEAEAPARFYGWTPEEVRDAVGDERAAFALAALSLPSEAELEEQRELPRLVREPVMLAHRFGMRPDAAERELARVLERLREVRGQRPGRRVDRRRFTAGNARAVSAFARAGLALGDAELVAAAKRAAGAVLERSREAALPRYALEDGVHGSGRLDDYAFLVAALLDLLEASGDVRWLDAALSLQAELERRFSRPDGGYTFVAANEEPGEAGSPSAKPASSAERLADASGIAALNALRLARWTAEPAHRERAGAVLSAFAGELDGAPTRSGPLLEALDFWTDTPREILIVTPGERRAAAPYLAELGRVFLPNRIVVAVGADNAEPLRERVPVLAHKRPLGGETTAYVCEGGVCERPARELSLFARQIRARPPPYPPPPAPAPDAAGAGPTAGPNTSAWRARTAGWASSP